MFESNDISSVLSLEQDGKNHQRFGARSILHIEEHKGQLHVYVPQDQEQQELCYATRLPRRLFEWLMTCPDTSTVHSMDEAGIRVTTSVLGSSPPILSRILEEYGIAPLEVPESEKVPRLHTGKTLASGGKIQNDRDHFVFGAPPKGLAMSSSGGSTSTTMRPSSSTLSPRNHSEQDTTESLSFNFSSALSLRNARAS